MKYAAVALAVVLAAFLRFYQLDSIPPGLHADEATDGNDARAAWRTGQFHVFYPENNGREGLAINLQAVALGLAGVARPWVVRWPSAVFGTLTVLGVFALGRQFGLQKMVWLAAWLMAASFWHINVSRMGTRVAAAPFFLVWSLWLMGNATGPRWLVWSGLAGLMYGLGFHTYTAYRVTPLLIAVVACRYEKRVLGVAGAVALLTVLPLAVFAAQQPDAFFHRLQTLPGLTLHDLARNTGKTIAMFNFAGDPSPRHNIPGRALLWWPVGLVFVAGVMVAARRQRALLWWLLIGLLPAIIANEGVPHAWRAVLAIPAAFLLAALGAEWLSERYRWRIVAPVLAVAVAVEAYRAYFVVWARDPRVAEWFDGSLLNVAARLDALPRELPKYVILDPDPMTVRGLPVAAQTIMFLTDTATRDRQEAKNLHYLWPDQTNQIALGYVCVYHIETTLP
jgi:4-amino-4-deoxy-L-arabinose transferase-like glycosyltransferase